MNPNQSKRLQISSDLQRDNDQEKALLYKHVFGNDSGRKVLKDILLIINGTKVDRNDPNAYSAVYKVAQMEIYRHITKNLNGEVDY
tara:strand:- start:582 stop:839 length:258 start_codon:yes stop_codon:yes gene_type:complete